MTDPVDWPKVFDDLRKFAAKNPITGVNGVSYTPSDAQDAQDPHHIGIDRNNPPLHESSTWLSIQRTLVGSTWEEPMHRIGTWGEDIFEWWQDYRKLSVDIEYGVATYTKVWGTDPDEDTEEGEVRDFRVLWLWLMENQ